MKKQQKTSGIFKMAVGAAVGGVLGFVALPALAVAAGVAAVGPAAGGAFAAA